MKNKCEECMDRFMELDKNERIPVSVTLHLLQCSSCRTQVRYLSLAEKLISIPEQAKNNEKEVKYYENPNPVTLTRWIISGTLMVFSMILFALFTKAAYSPWLAVSFYIVLGFSISIYCTVFVVQNLDFFIKKISTFQDIKNLNRQD